MAEPTTPPLAIERKMDRGTTTEITPWRPKKRIYLRERESSRGVRVLVDSCCLQIHLRAHGEVNTLVVFVL